MMTFEKKGNIWAGIVFLLFLFFLAFLGAKGVKTPFFSWILKGFPRTAQTQIPLRSVPAAPAPIVSDDWVYVPSNQNGAQGVHHGQLFYQKKTLPPSFEKEGMRLTMDIGTFRFSKEKDKVNAGGWFLIPRDGDSSSMTTLTVFASKENIANQEFKNGFYCTALLEKKNNTPLTWVLIDARDVSADFTPGEKCAMAWIDPSQLVYWINPRYCQSDEDCKCVSGSGVRFLGCGNRIWAPMSFGGAYECPKCRCLNQSCSSL